MISRHFFHRLLTILVLAVLGALLIYLPSVLYRQYQASKELGPFWGNVYLIVVGTGVTILSGISGWIVWRMYRAAARKKKKRKLQSRNPSQMSLADREAEVAQNLAEIERLRADSRVEPDLQDEIAPMIRWIEEKREQQRLEIVAFGTISSGKSSLLNALAGRDVFATDVKGGTTVERNEIPWPGMDQILLVDTPGLGEIEGSERQSTSAESAKDADLVLVVVDGPLRASEHELLARLAQMEKRVVICLNKEDWYTPEDRDALLGQISRQVADFVRQEDIIAVRSRPTERERVRVMSDGSQITEIVEVPPDIQPLADRMLRIIKRDGRDLLLANLLLQSRGLVDEAKDRVRDRLDKRAREIVDKYMWGAAGAAAITPLPMLDLAAGVAISSKMVLDLARVYHQEIDLNVAMNLIGQQGKTLIGVIGAEAIRGLASTIKAVPGAGTIAGGLIQAIVQAVITRWIGGVFIEYFKNEMTTPAGGMAALARREWERVTSVSELRKLVMSARNQFRGDSEDE
jgi:small GTP-binding protein